MTASSSKSDIPQKSPGTTTAASNGSPSSSVDALNKNHSSAFTPTQDETSQFTPRRILKIAHSRGFPNVLPIGTPSRQGLIRSDSTVLTCFDPADKELYDLWAPK